MFDIFRNRLEIEGTLNTITALRISAGRSTEPIGSDLPVVKDAGDSPFIPGSSFKGALRSRLEAFLRGIVGSDRRLVANPANEDEWSITATEMRSIKERFTDDAALTREIIANTDYISRLFGSPWLASKFQVRDLTVIPETWSKRYQDRDGVAIDRDTETAAENKLYDYQVVPAGTAFQVKIVVENAEAWELGLLMIGLHQFKTEEIPLGGGRSRGLGVVRLAVEKMRWFDYPENQPDKLIEYLQKLVNDDATAYRDAEDMQDEWVAALVEFLRNNTASPSQTTSQS